MGAWCSPKGQACVLNACSQSCIFIVSHLLGGVKRFFCGTNCRELPAPELRVRNVTLLFNQKKPPSPQFWGNQNKRAGTGIRRAGTGAGPYQFFSDSPRIGGRGAFLLLFLTLPALAHDVKDPVCRMTTDTDTTPYRETVGGKTYYFCSDTCKAKFDHSPASYLTLAQRLLHGYRTYSLALTTTPRPRPNHPVPLTFTIHEAPTGKIVRDFEIVHEKRLHFLMVSQDFQWFEHQHPQMDAAGRWHLTWTFPRAGRYWLFADFTPADGDNQILRTVLDVGRVSRQRPNPALVPDTGETKIVGDMRVRLAVRPLPMRTGRQTLLTYTFANMNGRPCTDMQPILGVMGHLIALREDGQTIVHTHALHGVRPGSYGAAMLAMMQAGQPEAVPVTPGMVTETGPSFTFKLTLPKPGRYKLWAQFQRHSQWLTVPFTVAVE